MEEIWGTAPLEGIYSGKKQIQLPTPLLQVAITKQKNTGLQGQCQGAFLFFLVNKLTGSIAQNPLPPNKTDEELAEDFAG